MNKFQQYARDHSPSAIDLLTTRRQFLARCGLGMGSLSLAHLLPGYVATGMAGHSTMSPRPAHFPARAKRVIHVFAQGAPSQVDTWDPKPELSKRDGQTIGGKGNRNGVAFASPFHFSAHGQCGLEVSEVFPELSRHVDKLALVRSMVTDIPSHDFGTLMMNTGSGRLVKPSMGAWVVYGLGSENQNLPGFIALASGHPLGGSQNWRSAFLPGVFQGTHINTRQGDVEKLIANLRNRHLSSLEQRQQLDLLAALNEKHRQRLQDEADLEARIQSFELAFQMQTEATDAFDVDREPEGIRERYQADTPLGRQLLMARRLVERGVRFVQVWHNGWDHHQNLETALRRKASECDQPLAALLGDLQDRGMLEDTLVVWGGEFGRTPTKQLPNQNNNFDVPGRNHNHKAFVTWLAGGGVKAGTVHGLTDEFGAEAVYDKVHVHDLHATILHLLGFDHERLTYRYNGRDFRLTDVHGNVVRNLLA